MADRNEGNATQAGGVSEDSCGLLEQTLRELAEEPQQLPAVRAQSLRK